MCNVGKVTGKFNDSKKYIRLHLVLIPFERYEQWLDYQLHTVMLEYGAMS